MLQEKQCLYVLSTLPYLQGLIRSKEKASFECLKKTHNSLFEIFKGLYSLEKNFDLDSRYMV